MEAGGVGKQVESCEATPHLIPFLPASAFCEHCNPEHLALFLREINEFLGLNCARGSGLAFHGGMAFPVIPFDP